MKKSSLVGIGAALLCSCFALTLTNCGRSMKIKTLPYPTTRMDTTVVDDYHGTRVADPYRWLEDDNSAETAAWVEAQNKVTFNYLEQIPYRAQVKERLTELMDYPKIGAPVKHGDYFYFFKNDGLQNQSVLYRKSALDAEPELFLDPNHLSDDGTAALASTSFSDDGKFLAYGVSKSGSDWVEMFVKSTEDGSVLPETIRWVKFSAASWDSKSEGFYYSRYDEPRKGNEYSGQNQFQKVYYHRLGQPQSADVLIYADAVNPMRYFSGMESSDGKYIFIDAREGTHGTEILYREKARANDPFTVLLPGFRYDYDVVECKDDKVYLYTNHGAPNCRLAAVDLRSAGKTLVDVLPENPEVLLQGVQSVGGYFIASYLEHAQSKVYQHETDGRLVREVTLSDIGTVEGFKGGKKAVETFYTLSTFTSPSAVYKYDLSSGLSSLYERPEVNYDPELFTTQQIFFSSKDGTRVPMFVVHRKDMQLDGNNPLLLYGYGGFNNSITPAFNTSAIMFMEQGGIYVRVNLRGGGEYGERWHTGGTLGNKQNVFDDFIGAAEYLIENKYTSSKKIAIMGASNGGLLVGACMTQRPELFAVAIPQVGVLDMLRYHLFTVGWGWIVEYGSSANPEQFEYLYKYSPLHNLREGTCYPATLITTADHDDRVVPAHSFKFAAALQRAQGCDNPVLIRIDAKAGHGAGKPTSKRIEEAADTYSFILWNTDTKVNFGEK